MQMEIVASQAAPPDIIELMLCSPAAAQAAKADLPVAVANPNKNTWEDVSQCEPDNPLFSFCGIDFCEPCMKD